MRCFRENSENRATVRSNSGETVTGLACTWWNQLLLNVNYELRSNISSAETTRRKLITCWVVCSVASVQVMWKITRWSTSLHSYI